MDTMKAIVKRSANPNDFELTKVPIPEISGNEMLIRVKAIGVGIHDGYFLPENITYPYPIGIEAAGVIEKTGGNVTGFYEGDRIAFVSAMQPKGGTWAEYTVVSEDSLIAPIPDEMGFEEAAAIPVAGNTTLKALQALGLKPNDSLFIAGASGAIGTFAIQLAVAKGCTVIGSASERNHEYMASLGASKVVDYNDPDWSQQIKQWLPEGMDAAMGIQPGTGITSMDVIKDGGKVIAISGDQIDSQRNIEVVHLAYHMNVKNELIELMNSIVSKEVKLFVEQTYPFEKGLEALQETGTRRARGKRVITMT